LRDDLVDDTDEKIENSDDDSKACLDSDDIIFDVLANIDIPASDFTEHDENSSDNTSFVSDDFDDVFIENGANDETIFPGCM
jgi:hypothetical protein